MTAAEMVSYLKSTVDEYGTLPVAFYVDPDDYYRALTAGQREVLADVAGGSDRLWTACRALVVSESLADGASLSFPCFLALSVDDETGNGAHVALTTRAMLNAYADIAFPVFGQASVQGDKLVTIPAGKTYRVRYLRYPADIGAGQDAELDSVFHPQIIEAARMVLVRKDISAPTAEYIESDRNRLEVFRTGKQPQQEGFQPRDVPYSNR